MPDLKKTSSVRPTGYDENQWRSGNVGECLFLDDVVCSYRTKAEWDVLDQCFECAHYKRWEREMDEEDERIMNEIDEERARRALE